MSQYVGSTKVRPLTERQALTAYTKMIEHLRKSFGYSVEELPIEEIQEHGNGGWPSGPVLVRNFEGMYGDHDWAVVWEGGDYEWTYLVSCGGTGEYGIKVEPLQVPKPIFVEAINGYAVGLYRL